MVERGGRTRPRRIGTNEFSTILITRLGPIQAEICLHLKLGMPGLGLRKSIQGTRAKASDRGGGHLIRADDERALVQQLNPSYSNNQIAASYNTRSDEYHMCNCDSFWAQVDCQGSPSCIRLHFWLHFWGFCN